jgi:hypothetical protein
MTAARCGISSSTQQAPHKQGGRRVASHGGGDAGRCSAAAEMELAIWSSGRGRPWLLEKSGRHPWEEGGARAHGVGELGDPEVSARWRRQQGGGARCKEGLAAMGGKEPCSLRWGRRGGRHGWPVLLPALSWGEQRGRNGGGENGGRRGGGGGRPWQELGWGRRWQGASVGGRDRRHGQGAWS